MNENVRTYLVVSGTFVFLLFIFISFISKNWSAGKNDTLQQNEIKLNKTDTTQNFAINSDNIKSNSVQPVTENVGPQWQYASLTPEIFNRIIQKIKSSPNAEIDVTKSGEQSSVTFHYSFVAHDPCEPLLKDFLVFEIESKTYVDENGQKYPNGPITDYYSMRDTDHDTYPEDYFTPGEPNPNAKLCDIKYLPLTGDTPDVKTLVSYWEAGMNYFAVNLLK